MNIKLKLEEIGLNPGNSIVIGSGILNALNIRECKDIDAVVDKNTYSKLSAANRFKKAENHGKEVLADDLFEIGTSWTVLGRDWFFEDLLAKSVVTEGVRYNTTEFLLEVKKGWLSDKDVRQKDIDDIQLIENFLASSSQ